VGLATIGVVWRSRTVAVPAPSRRIRHLPPRLCQSTGSQDRDDGRSLVAKAGKDGLHVRTGPAAILIDR